LPLAWAELLKSRISSPLLICSYIWSGKFITTLCMCALLSLFALTLADEMSLPAVLDSSMFWTLGDAFEDDNPSFWS